MERSRELPRSVTESFKYCPSCKATLLPRSICDILSYGLECGTGHRFFVPLETVKVVAHSGEFLNLKSSYTNREEITRDWLTNLDLRRHLNDQVAEVLRGLLEMKDNIHNRFIQSEAAKTGIQKFCPKCGAHVKTVGGDGYSVGLKCPNDHQSGERGYRLTFLHDPRLPDDSYLELCLNTYNPLGFIPSFTEGWWSQKSVAPQVREVLKQYVDELKGK